ncbi:MAG: methyltransferase, partial [Methylococcales bacterium]|nr:methyltransferase [Methylococcales bacterium]
SHILHAESRLLIINDAFGALTCALSQYQPINRSDSFVSQYSCQRNMSSIENQVVYQSSIDELNSPVDVVLIKVPKTLAFLQDQLIRLKSVITPQTQVIAAGMVKQIHTSTLNLFEQNIGTTKTSLATKKARLILSQVNSQTEPQTLPESQWAVPEYNLTIVNQANVFSREKLDLGARLLLENLPKDHQSYIDLGCGNGVIGFRLQQLNPEAQIQFIDESYMAVASAKAGYQLNFPEGSQATFLVNNALTGLKPPVDCIVCNPPFHQQHAIGDHIAWQMFTQAKAMLKQGGEISIVGNRHLQYHSKLKKIFGNVRSIASNKKFVVLSSTK